MRVEAFLESMNDPQLERCVKAIENQTVPFAKFTHVSGVSPASEAWNKGWELATEEWVALIDGDTILYPNCLELTIPYVESHMDPGVAAYCFGLYDPFIELVDNMFCICRSSVYKTIKAPNKLSFDRYVGARVKERGWRYVKNLSLIAGTHFEDPSEYQVFNRFTRVHKKYHMRHYWGMRKRLKEMLDKTGDPLYQVGLDSMQRDAVYTGSYSVEFEKKRYEEYASSKGIR